MSQFEKWETYPVTEEKLYYARYITQTEENARDLCTKVSREALRDMYESACVNPKPVKGQAMTEVNQQEIEDMFAKLQGMFKHISDTFVNASQLAQEVATLRSQVGDLSNEVNQIRAHNTELDGELQHVRGERNSAFEKISELNTENAGLRQACSHWQSDYADLQSRFNSLVDQHEATKRERDDAGLSALHWEEKHNQLKVQHEEIVKKLEEIASFLPKPKTEEPEYPKAVSSW